MVENLISGLYLVGDVALLGLLVYNSANRTIRSSEDVVTSTTASQSRACDNVFTTYTDLEGRGRDLSADGSCVKRQPSSFASSP
jgi:hypothetical protein